ncbi:tail fiber domain-containing protein [Citrobacter koseri]|uniref:tail fiber domain-containing protein n=1 Tax=Citrobacter koseri TaxID=545 RepID=UPI000DF0F6D0|nr:hypothetical protein [Citrobacter koseri]STB39471.1 Uncharacterised protein [Citrobacter koseri]STB73826.1 Uncharacterised protein [Citrobacter koseri]
MIYNTGTIAINGNAAIGTGTNWTAPASQIRVGQTIIVLSNPVQMFQITTINSATSLTVTPAASPALSGQKYGILVSDNLSVDGLAQSISQLINEYDENISAWEAFALTSANQTINVTINGTPVSIPALGKLVQKGVNGAVPVNQGGTGSTSASGARTSLGLGDVAVMDYDTHVRGGIPNQGQDTASFASAIQGWSRVNGLSTDSPEGATWGNMYTVCSSGLSAGNANTSTSGWYWKQIHYSNTNNIFHRTKVSLAGWSLWYQLTQSSVSDEALKNKGETLDPEEALSNVNAMDFLHFTYKFDEKNTPRRGVISQQIMGIDPQYVKKVGEYYHLDETPMLLDGLAAIKALRKRDEDNKLRIQELERGIEELKRVVRELADSAS